MKDYVIVGWPEIQNFMDYEDFEEHSTLINQNDIMGIGSSTYLMDKDWYNIKERK